MRLTSNQIRIIKEEVRNVFGPKAQVSLFGSRVDDHTKGGDIDLFVEADMDPADRLALELKFRARLIQRLGDQRIDVVVHKPGAPEKAIHRQARAKGVPL